MVKLNVHEAKTHLSRHLKNLEKGRIDSVLICRRNVPIAEIRPLERRRTKPRPIGLAKGTFRVPKSFFKELPDEILKAFNGE